MRGLKALFQMIQDQVPKNWVRLESYFAFWVDFMRGGQAQRDFMMRQQFITYLIDFVLEKQSPIKLYEKKHQMGNSYYSLNYENIFIIINELVVQNHHFSHTDKVLLYNFRFYDKVMRNLNAPSAITSLS